MSDQSRTPGSSPAGGPDANDPVYQQLERDRNALSRQADIQATPETDDEHRAVAETTGTGRRAAEAAGLEGDENARGDAQDAYQQSRGDRRPRDGRVD